MRRFGKEIYLTGFILFLFCMFVVSNVCFAGGLDKPAGSTQKSASSSAVDKKEGKLTSFLSLSQNYDNNVYLDSRRKEDGFTQAYFKTTLTTPLSEKTSRILEYNLMSLVYAEESNLNMVNNGLRAGLAHKINNKWSVSADYRFLLTDYVNTGSDDSWDHSVYFQAKEKLPFKMYHALGYEFMFKAYNDRKVKTITGRPTTKNREDRRVTTDYEIGKFFPKDQVKIRFQYYNNNSSERYLHYYDYDSYTGTFSLTHLFTKKFFGYCAYSRQITDYRNRTISTDNGIRQEDKTYNLTSALYYNLKKNLTVGLTFTYRNSWSNEPLERYQDSVVSLGTFYKF